MPFFFLWPAFRYDPATMRPNQGPAAPTPTSVSPADAPSPAERERDFYCKLLELGQADDIEPFLQDALALIVDITGARRGYVEVRPDPDAGTAPRLWAASGCHDGDIDAIRTAMSQGVIAEALATGRTVVTESALQDPRFARRSSVQRNRIEAVVCAPIGGAPPLGVVYLQDHAEGGPFTAEDRLRVEAFARHLRPFADRLLLRRREATDATLPFRRALRAETIIGRSAALARVLQQAVVAAPLDVTVLLTGPSGTGKTQLARVLHDSGPRAAGPFVELNCAALPEPLLESELFGAMPGAHSTASKKVEGKVAAAQGGTLFLDEIGELKPSAQAKLLQLLQSREYYPLGGSRPVRADVRIIAATNLDLKAAVQRRDFREDLFYRLQVLPIRLPALAERREDIPLLADHFCVLAATAHGLPRLRLSPDATCATEAAEWNGNARELAHAVEAAVIRAAAGGVPQIERSHLFPEAEPRAEGGPPGAIALDIAPYRRLSFQEATRCFQAELLRTTLEETGWNVTEAATRLDLARSHAYKLVRAFGLARRREPGELGAGPKPP